MTVSFKKKSEKLIRIEELIEKPKELRKLCEKCQI